MEKTFYCPDCSKKLERLYACGSDSYYCNECAKVISRKRIVSEEDMIEKVAKLVIETLDKG